MASRTPVKPEKKMSMDVGVQTNSPKTMETSITDDSMPLDISPTKYTPDTLKV